MKALILDCDYILQNQLKKLYNANKKFRREEPTMATATDSGKA
jgi:hypothetical protein